MKFTHRRKLLIIPLLCAFSFGACTSIKPLIHPGEKSAPPPVFSHEHFDRVLREFVNAEGKVNYAALQRDPLDLERYYELLSRYSPDSHPALFPSEDHRLSYWINAYNATVIKTVLTHYPIASVQDVRAPLPFFFLPAESGFFLFQRLTYGGRTTSLYALENQVIRKRFPDPRIHFALNCAAQGCPHLPQQAFTAERLDQLLERETRKFIAEARNFRVDHQAQAIWVSSIFDWYAVDFLRWHKTSYPHRKAALLDYIAAYLPADRAAELQNWRTKYPVRFIPYDWRLNDYGQDSAAPMLSAESTKKCWHKK